MVVTRPANIFGAKVRACKCDGTEECSIERLPPTTPRLAFNRIVVVRYRMHLESRGLAAITINQQLAAVRRLAHEAADSGLLSPELAAGISRMKGVKLLRFRSGNWLSAQQSSEALNHSYDNSMRAKRDYAMLAMLFGCGFRRSESVGLELDEIQKRQGHWAAVVRSQDLLRESRAGASCTARLMANLCEALPHQRRRVGADSIPAGARIRADHRTLSRLQTESRSSGKRFV